MPKIGIYYDSTESLWKAGLTPGWNAAYKKELLNALNSFGPVFSAAKQKSEFEFISALLRVRGVIGPGWDPWENTVEVVEKMQGLHEKADYESSVHLLLWIYGHIVEASEPYEILMNMLGIAGGGRWLIKNFQDRTFKNGKKNPLSPSEKIEILRTRAKQVGQSAGMAPLNGLVDKNLRNAIFHSDYSTHNGNVRISQPSKEYSRDEIYSMANHAIAYFEAIKFLIKTARAEYKKPKVVSVPVQFSGDRDEQAITMVREGEGLIGIKDNWTAEEIQKGKIPFRFGRFHQYELKMLAQDETIVKFPVSRVHRANRLLKYLPKFVSVPLAKKLKATDWF